MVNKAKYVKEYYKIHKENFKRRSKEYRHRLKIKVFTMLGNKCVGWNNKGCPFNCTDVRCLQIDHVNGDGVESRKKLRQSGGWAYYYYLLKDIKAGHKNNYQILCANCNWIKRFEKGEAN